MKWYNYLIIALLVLVTFLSAVQSANAALTDGILNYYKFNETGGATVYDSLGTNNITFDSLGMRKSETNFVGSYSLGYNGVNENLNFGTRAIGNQSTLSFWLLINGSNAFNNMYKDTSLVDNTALFYEGNNVHYVGFLRNDRLTTGALSDLPDNRSWTLWTFTNTPGVAGYKIYVNGVLKYNNTGESVGYMSSAVFFPDGMTGTYRIQGIGLWNRTLNSSEVMELYSSNAQYPFPALVNISISLKDSVTNVALQNFSININGSTYTTTNGSVQTNIFQNVSSLFNVSVFNISDNGGYFNNSFLNQNVSTGSLVLSSYQANVTFKAYKKVTSSSLSGNVTNGTYSYGLTDVVLPWSAGSFNVTFYNSSVLNQSKVFSINALTTNNIINITGIYNSTLNISAYTTGGSIINTFNGWVNYGSFNESFSTTTGSVLVGLITGYNYTIYAVSPSYAISSDTNYENVTMSSSSQAVNFTFYPFNSVYVTIKDEITGSSILSNCTLDLTGPQSSTRSVNQTYTYTNLTSGTYSLSVTNPLYQTRIYDVTVNEGSTQSLTIYLLNMTYSSNYVTFTIMDSATGSSLSNVSVIMSRLINNSWMPVETKMSDISGRTQLNYQPLIKYQFALSKTNYESQVFYLNPIIFTSYTLRMDPSISTSTGQELIDVSAVWVPKEYSTDEQNDFTLSITSTSGSLETYNYSLVYPGGSKNSSGNNALGETFTYNFNISNATAGQFDTVNFTYCFDSTLGPEHCYSYLYDISGVYPSGSWKDNAGNTYGMGLLERLLIATICIILVAGIFSLFIGVLAGGVIGLFLFAVFVAIGFIPIWALLISMLVGFFVIGRRSTQ